MVKKWIKDWLGINSDLETFVVKKGVRGILAKELETIFTEAITGEDTHKALFSNLFPPESRDEMFGRRVGCVGIIGR